MCVADTVKAERPLASRVLVSMLEAASFSPPNVTNVSAEQPELISSKLWWLSLMDPLVRLFV